MKHQQVLQSKEHIGNGLHQHLTVCNPLSCIAAQGEKSEKDKFNKQNQYTKSLWNCIAQLWLTIVQKEKDK